MEGLATTTHSVGPRAPRATAEAVKVQSAVRFEGDRNSYGGMMYAKIFSSIYDGTLVEKWEALVTFQQLLVLSDSEGIIDMTPQAIARRTGIPLNIIEEGIKFLESPDPYSRTPDDDGRRLERIDAHRDWGWRIVNHKKYRELRSLEDKRVADRERIARKRQACRALSQDVAGVADSRDKSHVVAEVAYTDTEVDTEAVKALSGKKPDGDSSPKNFKLREDAKTVIAFLNQKTGRNYEPVKANLGMIMARLQEGSTVEDCKQVIAKKAREWVSDEKMSLYLRPKTLFSGTNFAQYKGELGQREVVR